MKYYISFTGSSVESERTLVENVESIQDALHENGHTVDSSLHRGEPEAVAGQRLPDEYKFAQCMRAEFDAIDRAEAFLLLVQGEHIGTGQIMELSYAAGRGMPTLMASHESAQDNFLTPLVEARIVYRDAAHLGRLVAAATVIKSR